MSFTGDSAVGGAGSRAQAGGGLGGNASGASGGGIGTGIIPGVANGGGVNPGVHAGGGVGGTSGTIISEYDQIIHRVSITSGGSGGFGGGAGASGRYVEFYNGTTVFPTAGSAGFGGGGAYSAGGGANGGFGGGGGNGSGFGPANEGGFGAGNESGGGLGAGGDVFVMAGATLEIASGTLGAGTVTGGLRFGETGTGTPANGYGQAYGDGIFLQGAEAITFTPAGGQTVEIDGTIADMTGSHDATGQTGVGTLIMNGAGTLYLSANNTYHTVNGTAVAGFTGGVTLNSGTLELGTSGSAGSSGVTIGAHAAATLVLDVPEAATIAGTFTETVTLANFASDDFISIKGETWQATAPATAIGTTANPLTFSPSGFTGHYDFVATYNGTNLTISEVAESAPVTTVPGSQSAIAGRSLAISGLSVTDSDAVIYGETTTVVVSDADGSLSATAATGATVSGSRTTLTLSGTLAGVNAELATLAYLAPAVAGGPVSDTITVATSDGRGGSDTRTITVGSRSHPR